MYYRTALSLSTSYIENMDKRTKLRTLYETRWTIRADALYTFKTAFPVVVHASERLQGLRDQGRIQDLWFRE
jgi:hypothetical protein